MSAYKEYGELLVKSYRKQQEKEANGGCHKRTRTKHIGHLTVTFEIEVFDGEELDTTVLIGDDCLCVISGDSREEFTEKLEELVDEYRI